MLFSSASPSEHHRLITWIHHYYKGRNSFRMCDATRWSNISSVYIYIRYFPLIKPDFCCCYSQRLQVNMFINKLLLLIVPAGSLLKANVNDLTLAVFNNVINTYHIIRHKTCQIETCERSEEELLCCCPYSYQMLINIILFMRFLPHIQRSFSCTSLHCSLFVCAGIMGHNGCGC